MPQCRRDQTSFGIFLAVMVFVETILIFTVMHLEHRDAERLAQEKRRAKELDRQAERLKEMSERKDRDVQIQSPNGFPNIRSKLSLPGTELTSLTKFQMRETGSNDDGIIRVKGGQEHNWDRKRKSMILREDVENNENSKSKSSSRNGVDSNFQLRSQKRVDTVNHAVQEDPMKFIHRGDLALNEVGVKEFAADRFSDFPSASNRDHDSIIYKTLRSRKFVNTMSMTRDFTGL